MATEVWFLELAQKGHTVLGEREFFQGAPERLSLLSPHTSSHQRAYPAEAPAGGGNTWAAAGPQLRLSPLKPETQQMGQKSVRDCRMQENLMLYWAKNNDGKVGVFSAFTQTRPHTAMGRAAFEQDLRQTRSNELWLASMQDKGYICTHVMAMIPLLREGESVTPQILWHGVNLLWFCIKSK